MTAFRATFSDMKLVKTRQVAQLIFEIPLSDFDAAYEVLGGMPNPALERWFGIAAISPAAKEPSAKPDQSPKPDRAKRDWKELPAPQQAGIRINEPSFAAYLKEQHPNEWRETGDADGCIKFMFRIGSKTELKTNHKAMMLWRQLDDNYQAWKVAEHA